MGGYPSCTEVSDLRSKSRLAGVNKPKALVTAATDKTYVQNSDI